MTTREKQILLWFSQEEKAENAPPHETEMENLWRQQGGISPETGEPWLTPRMQRNAIRLDAAFRLEENGIRKMIGTLPPEPDPQ